MNDEKRKTAFLIATVGGSPEPIVASIMKHEPARVVFVVSEASRASIDTDREDNGRKTLSVLNTLTANGVDSFAGRYDYFNIRDPQNYSTLVGELRELDSFVDGWKRDYGEIELIIDFTGGTKPMSAAMALIASRWEGASVTYVGGTERSKGGVGVTVSGKEQIVNVENPWTAMGYIVEEQAKVLFNRGNFTAAIELLVPVRKAVSSPRKEEIHALAMLCEFCQDWDLFRHAKASKNISALKKNLNNFSDTNRPLIREWLEQYKDRLKNIAPDSNSTQRLPELVRDLIGNAVRKWKQGFLDDAAARLYRAIEAYAQYRLQSYGFNDTGNIPLENLPDALKPRHEHRAQKGIVRLGLHDSYEFLEVLGDEASKKYYDTGLGVEAKNPLIARNQSILAHGFNPVSPKDVERLTKAALALTGLTSEELLVFPVLS